MSKKIRFICRRAPEDTVLVEMLNADQTGKELYLRFDKGDSWKGSVVLNAVQAVELARRITEQFGTSPSSPKLWEES